MELFKDYYTREALVITHEQVFNIILTDKGLESSTKLHRELLTNGQSAAADKVKESTPQVAVSFHMEGGKDKNSCRECQYEVLVDFDAKKPEERLPKEELERVFTVLRTSNHTKLGYESISGLGYHVIVPFRLPDGVTIDLASDRQRGEEIFKRVHRYINNIYSVWCGHEMDKQCANINRMSGLSHDPLAVYHPDAYPFCPTREELGIDAEGHLVKMHTPTQALGKSGNRISVPLGNSLERAAKMVEDSGEYFVTGNHHNFVMRVSFILNRMGVDEEEAAQALDDAYRGEMKDIPSKTLHSCYKTAADEFGVWMPKRSKVEVKTEVIAKFLRSQTLQYDVLTQKTQRMQDDGKWKELSEREENDLYMECCAQTDLNLTTQLFRTVLNSNVVPEVNPLMDYVVSLPKWTPNKPDFIDEVASMVHMASEAENQLWHQCFKKWMVAMVAGWEDENVVNHQVIVFIGKQGIYKSTWLNRLLPPQLAAYTTDHIDLDRLDKDERLRAAEYGLINIDELDKLTDRQLNKIKAMITSTHVDERASYGRHKEKRVRIASYVASGNKEEFLTDQTGNRRWLPFHVVSIDSPFSIIMPYEGMYSQALHLLHEGFNYWFDLNDIQRLKSHVDDFMVPVSEEQLIQVYFSPIKADQPGAQFLTLAEIGAKLTLCGNLRKEPEPRRLGAIMTKLGYEKATKGHNKMRGYIVYEHTQREVDKMHDPKGD